MLEAGVEVGAFVGLDDVPHLGLAHLAVFAHGHLVIGMHLNAQVLPGIDELDEQGQLAMIFFVDGLAKNGVRVFCDDGDQVAAFPLAIGDDAGAGGNGAHFPAFANGGGGRFQAFVRPEPVAPPKQPHGGSVRKEMDRNASYSRIIPILYI